MTAQDKIRKARAGLILDSPFFGALALRRDLRPDDRRPTMATDGQIQGGVAQGLGWALMENMATEKGSIINPDFLDYLIPTAMDVPNITPILVEPIEPNGPYGAKGIGEPALNPAMSAITNAIYNATGIRIKELPVSAEKILAELKQRKGAGDG